MKFLIHSPQSDADDIPMMQFAAEIIAQFEPQIVHEIDIFRPESRRMRTKIHKDRRPIRRDNFQRKRVARFRQASPMPGQCGARVLRNPSAPRRRSRVFDTFNVAAVCTIASNGFDAGHRQ